MNIKDLGDSISHFNGLAVCIVSSDSYKVLYCNQNFKGIIPNVDVGSNINEIFPKFIEHERNNLLKEYASDVNPMEKVPIQGHCTYLSSAPPHIQTTFRDAKTRSHSTACASTL